MSFEIERWAGCLLSPQFHFLTTCMRVPVETHPPLLGLFTQDLYIGMGPQHATALSDLPDNLVGIFTSSIFTGDFRTEKLFRLRRARLWDYTGNRLSTLISSRPAKAFRETIAATESKQGGQLQDSVGVKSERKERGVAVRQGLSTPPHDAFAPAERSLSFYAVLSPIASAMRNTPLDGNRTDS